MIYLRLYTILVTAFGLLGCLYFITSYWVRTGGGWWDSEAGRFMMFTYMNLAALLALVLSGQLFGGGPIRTILSLMLYTIYAIQAWWPARLLYRTRVRQRTREGGN